WWVDVAGAAKRGVFYDGGPRSYRIGFRQKDAVDISLLCALHGHLDFSLAAAAQLKSNHHTPPYPSDFEIDVVGSGNACGKLGVCPFCVKGCKRVTLSGEVDDGGIHFHLNYCIESTK